LMIIDGSNGKCTNLEVNPGQLHVNFTKRLIPIEKKACVDG
jgi:hypothetical protein